MTSKAGETYLSALNCEERNCAAAGCQWTGFSYAVIDTEWAFEEGYRNVENNAAGRRAGQGSGPSGMMSKYEYYRTIIVDNEVDGDVWKTLFVIR